MTRTRTIRRRLLGDQVLLILLLGGALMATTFLGARRAVETLSRTIIERAADQAESELRRFFDPVVAVLGAVVTWERGGLLADDDPETGRELLLPITENLPQISGIGLAREDGSGRFLMRAGHDWTVRRTDPSQPAADGFDPRERPWFHGAIATGPGSIFWTEPYEFLTLGKPGMTLSTAYQRDSGLGIAALDVTVSDLRRFARGIEVSPGGSLWILTESRRLLAWPDDPAIWGSRDPSEALLNAPEALELPLIDDSVEALLNRDGPLREPVRFSSGSGDWWADGRRFELSADRTLLIVVLVPHADLLGVRARLRVWILAITLAVLAAGVVRASVLARRFSESIEALARESDRMSRGDLEKGEPVTTGVAEVQQLADSHERMRRGLKTLIKLEDDLQVARQIQRRTWPSKLPTLAGFEIAAWSRPADETGGDSYDVIGLDRDGKLTDGEAVSLVLMLADATGHGIGPALSVTQLRAMLRMAVRNGSTLAETAAQMNEQLYADLPNNRFITAWLGRLERDGGLATFSAGQAPLFLYRSESGEVDVLGASAPPLGLLPPAPIALLPDTKLAPGDIYVVLSDGFYEAESPDGREFEKGGVIEVLREQADRAPAAILQALRSAVREFTGDAPLADDRTAVIVKRTRSPWPAESRTRPALHRRPPLLDFSQTGRGAAW